jgi:predicted Ser/Thr protein kinase
MIAKWHCWAETGNPASPESGDVQPPNLHAVLEAVEMMLGFPAEQPEAFDVGSLRTTVKAAHKLLAAALAQQTGSAR